MMVDHSSSLHLAYRSPCSPFLDAPNDIVHRVAEARECWNDHTLAGPLFCTGGGRNALSQCFSAQHELLPTSLAVWNAWHHNRTHIDRILGGPANVKCRNCQLAEATTGRRPCSRSDNRQEAWVLELLTALGVSHGGLFVEVGGNDGLKASNTVHAEYCRGWRGVLIEANPVAFGRMLHNRPGVLSIRGAVCARAGTVSFAARSSKSAAMRTPTADLTGGVESQMPRSFERSGYAHSAPTAWLSDAKRAVRFAVPCAPISALLGVAGVTRVDVLWLDVEGGERAVLESMDPPPTQCPPPTPHAVPTAH
jgi:FkbM family methyltransferase